VVGFMVGGERAIEWLGRLWRTNNRRMAIGSKLPDWYGLQGRENNRKESR